MREEEFWRITPRKLFALLGVHNKLNNPDSEEENQPKKEAKKLTLEEALAWAKR